MGKERTEEEQNMRKEGKSVYSPPKRKERMRKRGKKGKEEEEGILGRRERGERTEDRSEEEKSIV